MPLTVDLLRSACIAVGLLLAAEVSNGVNNTNIQDKIRAALAHPDRPAADRARDQYRHPEEVLALVGVTPGMHIADLMAGSGWYTEVLARAVGPTGRIYAQNNRISNGNYGGALTLRLESSKLENVVRLDRELEDPGLPSGRLDAVFLVQFYHDTYWMSVDRALMNRKIFEALKPGGVFCVIDHRAEPGSGRRDAKNLHRIDPELLKEEILATDFILDETSDLLENPDDDHTLSALDGAIRGRTDRFLFKFRKPE